jgi:hypothetical protein
MTPLIDVQWKMLRAPEMTQASRQAGKQRIQNIPEQKLKVTANIIIPLPTKTSQEQFSILRDHNLRK